MHQDIAETIFFQRILAPAPPTEGDLRTVASHIASTTPWRSLVNDVMNAWAYGDPDAEIHLQIARTGKTYDCLAVRVDQNPDQPLDLSECLLSISDTNIREGWENVSLQAGCEVAIANLMQALHGLLATAFAAEEWIGDRELMFRAIANMRAEAEAMDFASN